MLKQFFVILILSVLIIIFAKHLALVMHFLNRLHEIFSYRLSMIFSGGHVGRIIRETLAIVAIPAVVGLVIGGTYWLFARKEMPGLLYVIWISWVCIAVNVILHH